MDGRIVNVGIMSARKIEMELHGSYRCSDDTVSGEVSIDVQDFEKEIVLVPTSGDCYAEVSGVTIGVNFHWQRRETQSFLGTMKIVKDGDALVLINAIGIEDYLKSVISSEMSATSSIELLKAHAVISRSWVLAQMQRAGSAGKCDSTVTQANGHKHVVWYDHDDHTLFDVCADDHCQRYQGVTRASTPEVAAAVEATRTQVLVSGGELCDARFSKCCGGVMEQFENCWADTPKPYLVARADLTNEREQSVARYSSAERRGRCDEIDIATPLTFPDLTDEAAAIKWILGAPPAFCNTTDKRVLGQVLNNYDMETPDFYRWKVSYTTDALSELVARKSGIDFGRITDLVPLQRGTSGRIVMLRIVGERATVDVGKELEIRRWLSETHLYSSAFVVDHSGNRFTLHGAGWGHGVGLCQIGAAMMAEKGYNYREILAHYYPGSKIAENYNQ